MQNKVVLVTGANSGIGLYTVIGLAQQGATVILHARNKERGQAALAQAKALSGATRIELMLADFESVAAVRALAGQVRRQYDRLDVLVNNAAIIPRKRALTEEGLETQFAVNYLAGFVLTQELLPLLKKSGSARIVNVSSSLHATGRWIRSDPQGAQQDYGFQGWGWYGVTKFYNVLHTYELARRLTGTGITANCLHPGVIGTNLTRGMPKIISLLWRAFMPGPEKGAETSKYLASAPDIASVTGKYFTNKKAKKSAFPTYDEKAQHELWDYTERLLDNKQDRADAGEEGEQAVLEQA